MVRLMTPWYLYNPRPQYSGNFFPKAAKIQKKIPISEFRYCPNMGKGMNIAGSFFEFIGKCADIFKKVLK